MKQAWLASIDYGGLKTLVLETDHARPFVLKRARRDGLSVAWAILEQQHAVFIKRLLDSGRPAAALNALGQLAWDGGFIDVACFHEHEQFDDLMPLLAEDY